MKVEEIKENGKKVIEKHKQKILIAGATIAAFIIGATVGRKFGLLEVESVCSVFAITIQRLKNLLMNQSKSFLKNKIGIGLRVLTRHSQGSYFFLYKTPERRLPMT